MSLLWRVWMLLHAGTTTIREVDIVQDKYNAGQHPPPIP